MSADRWLRRSTSAVVVAVAGFAAVVSYSHIYDLGRANGQAGTAARLLPLSVDGLILAASLVMLHEARRGARAPALARSMLGLGVGATVAANIAYGASYGWLGAVISAWPAVAFVGAAEMVIALIRGPGRAGAHQMAVPVPLGAPADAETAAAAALRASIAGGNELSQNQLISRFNLTRGQASRVRQLVAAESNGHRELARPVSSG